MMELCEQVQTTNIHASDSQGELHNERQADFGPAPSPRTTLARARANSLPAIYNNNSQD
jgi:hypothetical protein